MADEHSHETTAGKYSTAKALKNACDNLADVPPGRPTY
jgi:hypothetical protein